jgi:hypothetical protein
MSSAALIKVMSREFHILAFDLESRFILKGAAEGVDREFRSLFEAACHARTFAGDAGGHVVISDEFGRALNRIPFRIPS